MGEVSFVSVDQSAKSNRGLVVASETGVLAVLSPHDGSISECSLTRLLPLLLYFHVIALPPTPPEFYPHCSAVAVTN